jgi:hypothetical protein
MSRTTTTIFGFALAGVLGAAVAMLASNFGSATPMPTTDTASKSAAELEQALARVERLEARVEILEKAPPMANGSTLAPAASMSGSSEADASPIASADAEAIDERVRELVKETQTNQMKQMGKAFEGMAKQREAGMLNRLAKENGLNDWQRTEMERLLERRRAAIGEFFRSMFGGEGGEGGQPVDMSQIRKKIEDVQRETDEEIKTVLTPDQYEAFQSDEANRRGGPFGGGRGPGGGR